MEHNYIILTAIMLSHAVGFPIVDVNLTTSKLLSKGCHIRMQFTGFKSFSVLTLNTENGPMFRPFFQMEFKYHNFEQVYQLDRHANSHGKIE